MRGTRGAIAAVGTLAALLGAGCGGMRQDADEPVGTFPVEVVDASFPRAQHVAKEARLRIEVRNAGKQTIPNVAVTVHGFDRRVQDPRLQDPTRPLWILDEEPPGGHTAYASTWALGTLPPGASKRFVWSLMPVVPGVHRVRYEVSAGLDGLAKARTRSGQLPQGSFQVRVSDRPARTRVTPSGRIAPLSG